MIEIRVEGVIKLVVELGACSLAVMKSTEKKQWERENEP